LEEGTLGGQYTTIEGLLTQVKEQVGDLWCCCSYHRCWFWLTVVCATLIQVDSIGKVFSHDNWEY